MTSERITPQKMAAVYWIKLGRSALRNIDLLLDQYNDAPNTHDYWLSVRAFVLEFAKRKGKKH